MKITVIGQWGGFPETGEATAGYLVEQDGYHLLIDCGSGVISNLQRYIKLEDIDAVVLTHYHYDHVSDIGPLQYAWLTKTQIQQISRVLPIYGHSEDCVFNMLTMEPYTKGLSYSGNSVLHLGPFQLDFCRTSHPVPCYAIRIITEDKCVVFSGDTSYFEALVDFAYNADLLICECSLYDTMDGSVMGHMNSSDAGKLASMAKVQHLLLTHLPHYGDHRMLLESIRSKFNGKVDLASMGWTWQKRVE